ncbi:MAG TPA: DUF1178 family protein [Tabrizicola sp.]|nr:DUF1178 family protein [Tabrizicola sp.]
MIRYSLKCTAGHQFESWFQNADAFGALKAAGRLTCAICGDAGVEKDLMAPGVQSGGAATRVPAREAVPHNRPDLSLPESEIERAVAAWRKHVESHSEYVGVQFAREVRRIHNGEAPERLIHGEARPEVARELIEEGLPVAPLPFLPSRKMN